jgi:hypothetical protein
MNRLIVVIVLNDGHSSASNRKFPIRRRDSLSCTPYPFQDAFRSEWRVFQLNVELNLRSSYVQKILWGLRFDLGDRRGIG